jgi:hypothetical protein
LNNSDGIVYDSNAQKVVVFYKDIVSSSATYSFLMAVVGTVSGTSISFGTPVVMDSSIGRTSVFTNRLGAFLYDPTSQKIIVAFKNSGNNGYGTAIVGTVSGTSISFGTSVVFRTSAISDVSMTYDTNAQKVVIGYADGGNSNYVSAVVGTVSGTSISFGTPVVFTSNVGSETTSVYDPDSQRIVIAYLSSNRVRSIVGTVSGTSISFGTETPVYTININSRQPSATYDSSAQKIVIVYKKHVGSTLGEGQAVVGTINPTFNSITFSTPVVFNSATSEARIIYDSVAQKVVIAYAGSSSENLIVGSVSGNSVSFGQSVLVSNVSALYRQITYDSNSEKSVIVYENQASVFQTSYNSTNITSTNYIGFSSDGYVTGQSATINTKGSIDNSQSGLVAGQSYYLQTDGTLGLTPDNPSVFAGTAISDTKIIVKG